MLRKPCECWAITPRRQRCTRKCAKSIRTSLATVYRNLNLLAERGELAHVAVPNGADRYELRCDPHYHLCCSQCGKIFDAEMPYQADLAERLGDTQGFRVTGHLVIFTGLCADCRAAAREAALRG